LSEAPEQLPSFDTVDTVDTVDLLASSSARQRPRAHLRESKRAELRQRIFTSALDLFRRQGVAATTIRQIAEAANVGLGTFFNYFDGKEAVLAEFGRIGQERIAARLSAQRQAGSTTRERITDVLLALVDSMQEEPDLARAVVFAAMASPDIFHGERARFIELSDLLAETLREGQSRGEVAVDCDVEAAAHLIISIYVSLTLDWAARANDYELGPTLLAHVETLWRGVCSNQQGFAMGRI
jgi:AcrR family transcriptional regulator